MDKTNSANSSQIDIATFLRDYGVLRVFSLEQLKKERTHKMVLKARAKLVVKAHEILLKTAR